MSDSATIDAVTPQAFEEQLRQLDRVATLVRQRPGRETWRFVYTDKPYYLHFYTGPKGQRIASNEFAGLKTLQDFKIPAVRVVAFMSGFRFGERKGDAIITQGIEPAIRLNELIQSGLAPKMRRGLLNQLTDILQQMARHDVGHESLSLSSFLVSNDKLYLLDGAGIRSGGLLEEQLLGFAHGIYPHASRADRMRVWTPLFPDTPLPVYTSEAKRYANDLRNDAIESIRIGEWSGVFRTDAPWPLSYSRASHLHLTGSDWQTEWPRLLDRVQADQLDILKRDASGDVLSTEITLQNRPIDVIVKRPKNKFWYRYLFDLVRMSRAKRLWEKARWLQVRKIDVEYPMIVMERRRFGYVVEAIAIFERVPGQPLEEFDLNSMSKESRSQFFCNCGRILRRIEATGLSHTDAKSSNWIVHADEAGKWVPVLIDAYGLRPLNAFLGLFGIRRLLRAMRKHPQYTPEDSLNICLGFAPNTSPQIEEAS